VPAAQRDHLLRLGVVNVRQRRRFAEIFDEPREVGLGGFRVSVVLRPVVPKPGGNVVYQQRLAGPRHRLDQRVGFLALYGFEAFRRPSAGNSSSIIRSWRCPPLAAFVFNVSVNRRPI
jgi:hypothetical protein